MSRSGYTDDGDYINLYRAAVERAINGKRGQSFLQEMAKAMDEMPEKRLIASELIAESGEVCAIGSVCKARGLDVSKVDCYDADEVCSLVGISRAMASEIAFENDERRRDETPEQRWVRMRKWITENLMTAPRGEGVGE